MANRQLGYGVEREDKIKIEQKRSPEREREVTDWIEEIVGSTLKGLFEEGLKDGVMLCKLINKLQPGSVKKISEQKTPFNMMENIANFLEACTNYGISKENLFQTVDLYEAANIPRVANTIYALGRKAQTKGFSGRKLGPKEVEPIKRQWSKEQRLASEGVIPLQAGYAKGATQAGHTPFGIGRQISHNPEYLPAEYCE